MKLLMRDEAKGREHTIFVTIFSALMVMLAIVVMLMASATAVSGVTLQLDKNAVDILDKQVENRAGYIQDQLQQAQELTDLSTYINETTQQMLDDETLSLKTLDSSSSDSLPLLQAAAPRMLETLRSKRISGIFLILNTHDFTGRTSGDRLPCVYLRDLDPDAAPSVVNSDILLECAPSELVQTFDIATDKAWSPALQYLDGEQDVFYVRPFQTAYEDDEPMGAANYGRWTTLPYKLRGDDREAIAYAQPLILDDGTVYGVLGVELLESYMDTKLPWDELQNDHHGSYLLASTTSDLRGEVLTLHVTSNTGEQSVPLQNAKWELTLQRSNNCWYYMMDGKQQIASIRQIGLYSRNAPFSGERWLLVGVVGGNDLFSFSQSVTKLLGLAVLLTLGIGLACAFFVSYGLAQPIAQLSKELMDAQEQRKAVPEFSRTGIRELDRFAEAITQLNSSLVTNSTKFLRIMDMASVELGGYELRFDTGSVYVTDNFFALLGASQPKDHFLSVRRFEEKLSNIQLSHPCTTTAEGDKILTIRREGETRYIMLRVTNDQTTQVGLAEDLTAATQERLRIERERDYDVLTGLYNRQAFHRVSHELFQNPERLGVAALLMMDLDDLKHINDTYGHDWGDHYIQNTGRCIAEHSPPGTVCARLSGDEFLLLFYGYPGREQLREKLEALTRAMQQAVVVLPSGSDLHISISGGVAWYPEDGRDIETLKKYADFAMYQVKHSTKGQMKDFDIGVYNQEAYIARTRREFHQLISEERMYYYFQPIFSAQTGRVHAYEALMRSDLPTLRSPATIMKLAREQGALYEIERLTFRKALEGFDNLRSKNLVDRQALIFINSIASVCLRREDSEYMDQRWHELRRQMVIEITEEEELNLKELERKRYVPGASGTIALDDSGSGYSNGNSLLTIDPRYVKVDISIIRNIDTNTDKQQFLVGLVTYAKPRSIQVLAEGVETMAELQKVLELGVDLLQGYGCARPALVPGPIAPEAMDVLREVNEQKRWKTE